MKKHLIFLLAAAGLLAGCDRLAIKQKKKRGRVSYA